MKYNYECTNCDYVAVVETDGKPEVPKCLFCKKKMKEKKK